VACGDDYTACVSSTGELFTFGKGRSMCLGHEDKGLLGPSKKAQPEAVKALAGQHVRAVAAGQKHIGVLSSKRFGTEMRD
jgi:alpha-tubulin suppressor-like RCC1 family protein